jgi:adenine-specific DNA-methyltransferase
LTTDEGDFLAESREVVLSWPYKDCVLEGGQTKEDAKRNEVFWNEILAPDEINRLTEPKVLTNFKKFDADGEHNVESISKADNLIIKGNNLLALHSLKKNYAGQVKLIYIDPPYNTSSAATTFNYNNTFNHSAWMTFMQNRLEVARKLLTDDGLLFVAIDHYELFYLGVTIDSIFGRQNRLGVITVVSNPGGRQDEKFFPTSNEFMLVYAKNIDSANLNTLGISDEKIREYRLFDNTGNYKLRGFRRSGNNSLRTERPGLFYSIYYNPRTNNLSLEDSEGSIVILPIDEQGVERCWRWGANTFLDKKDNYIEVKKVKDNYDIYIKEREDDYQGEKPKTVWDKSYYTGQSGTTEIKNLLGEKLFSYPKSPHLMKDVIKIATAKNDIVIDFFGGSGTTAHAVLELNKEDNGNRRFILCEQMDYVDYVTSERIKKVIEINGKGSVIYCELAKANQEFADKILASENKEELSAIWKQMQETGFLSWKVNPKTINENAEDFASLSVEDTQKFLLEALDKNLLYIPYSEIDNQEFGISKEDKQLNANFYGKA